MSDDSEPRKRSDAERIRLVQANQRLRGLIDSIDSALSIGSGPIGSDMAQAILTSASDIAIRIAKHDAFELYEQDTRNRAKPRPTPCGKDFKTIEPGRMPSRRATCVEGTLCSSCSSDLEQWLAAQHQSAF